MSNSDKPQTQALDELERVLNSLAEELASWRRRALRAEAGGGAAGGDAGEEVSGEVLEKVAGLESENRDLTDRVTSARERVDGLLTRLHFLEEQVTGD